VQVPLPGFIAEVAAWYQVRRTGWRGGRWQRERVLPLPAAPELPRYFALAYPILDEFLRISPTQLGGGPDPAPSFGPERVVGTFGCGHIRGIKERGEADQLRFWLALVDLLLLRRPPELHGADRQIVDRVETFVCVSRWRPARWTLDRPKEGSRRSTLTQTCLVQTGPQDPSWQDIVAYWSLDVAAKDGRLDLCPECGLPYPSERGTAEKCPTCRNPHGSTRGRPVEVPKRVWGFYETFRERVNKWRSLRKIADRDAKRLRRNLKADVSLSPKEFTAKWERILADVASAKAYSRSHR